MPDASEPTSLSLLSKVKTQDDQAWQHLVHLYGPLVHRWCRRSNLNEADTADVFQETFRAVSAHIESFQPNKKVGSFRSWLRTIVRSKVNDHFRRVQRQPVGRGGSEAQLRMAAVVDHLEDEHDAEAETDHAEVVRRALEMIQPEFNERNWEAFIAVAIDGESATDVAERFGIQAQTVRQANYRIRRRLRVILQDLGD